MTKRCIDSKQVEKLLEKYPAKDGRSLIHALQDLQAAFNYLPFEAVEMLCLHTNPYHHIFVP